MLGHICYSIFRSAVRSNPMNPPACSMTNRRLPCDIFCRRAVQTQIPMCTRQSVVLLCTDRNPSTLLQILIDLLVLLCCWCIGLYSKGRLRRLRLASNEYFELSRREDTHVGDGMTRAREVSPVQHKRRDTDGPLSRSRCSKRRTWRQVAFPIDFVLSAARC